MCKKEKHNQRINAEHSFEDIPGFGMPVPEAYEIPRWQSLDDKSHWPNMCPVCNGNNIQAWSTSKKPNEVLIDGDIVQCRNCGCFGYLNIEEADEYDIEIGEAFDWLEHTSLLNGLLVEQAPLSQRTKNALHRNGINTAIDLWHKKNKLHAYTSVGKSIKQECFEWLDHVIPFILIDMSEKENTIGFDFVKRIELYKQRSFSKYKPLFDSLDKLKPGQDIIKVPCSEKKELLNIREGVYKYNRKYNVKIKTKADTQNKNLFLYRDK